MKKRKFYKTRICFDVLSEDPIGPCMNLMAIVHECTDGDYMKGNYSEEETQISGKEMAKLSEEFGGEPRFFRLDKRGRSLKA